MTDRFDANTVQSTPIHDAESLTDGGNLARIRLNEAEYTLRITRQGKLILTK
ncbi:hemin uptake protein HemP [Shimia sp. R9_2]|uniref:hemin uptake protein HemP n=1 Tax=unclassified Shimia TaxID=2630038 RepID=UPI001ADAB385|nr:MULTISPECIES: hemin uptake protein HemP [unclassified Shimia]MBO9397893.1 hemin uptake protein HemP [Shimia sp. R9_2]MBO9400944.1 hemin uptake protein HemP [Shimia sp. R9_3]